MSQTTRTPHFTPITTLLITIAACEPPRTGGKHAGSGFVPDAGDSADETIDDSGEDGRSGPATLTDDLTGMVFRRIEPSSFVMGCTDGQTHCYSDESPPMPVTLTYAHYMGETEVTQAQFEAAMGYNPSLFGGCADCPVETITWHEAAALSNALSLTAGLAPCYPCRGSGVEVRCTSPDEVLSCEGYRLPTEAEWEGAARCGADTVYAGSDDANAVGWTWDNSSGEPHPVGLKLANACGLYDMTGDVFEWATDRYAEDYYLSSGRSDPSGAASGVERVHRGGSWFTEPRVGRVATRIDGAPNLRRDDLGVRLLRAAP